MIFDNLPIIKFLYGLGNMDFPANAKKNVNPTYDFSRLIFSYEKNDISWIEEDYDDTRNPADVLNRLYEMNVNCRKPVVISKSFFAVMEKSEDSFTPFHNEIIEECEGECGVVHAPYLMAGAILLYSVKNGKLEVWVVMNKKDNGRTQSIPSAYLSVFPKDNIKGVGHQLVVDYIPLYPNYVELPIPLYTHAFTILTYLCLRKWAEVEVKEVKNLVKKEVKKNKKTMVVTEEGIGYFTFDSKWYTEIINNNDFKVSGHFRLQPYADGSRKLIYIDEFVKHGYHRKALIDKVKDGELVVE